MYVTEVQPWMLINKNISRNLPIFTARDQIFKHYGLLSLEYYWRFMQARNDKLEK